MLASCCRDLNSDFPKASFSDRFHCAYPEVVSRALKKYILNTNHNERVLFQKSDLSAGKR